MAMITAQIPSADTVKIAAILDTSQQVTDRWKAVNNCKKCQLDRPLLQTLASASTKLVTLHEAASKAYVNKEEGQSTPRRRDSGKYSLRTLPLAILFVSDSCAVFYMGAILYPNTTLIYQ